MNKQNALEAATSDFDKTLTADDADALAALIATEIAILLREAIDTRAAASLVVSGGTTPAPVFDRLARDTTIDWARVWVTLADERAVPRDDPASNERLVREHLLTGPASTARFVSQYREDGDLDAVARALDAMPRPLDVVLLGMGTDGHTASLFPDAPELEDAMTTERPVMAMHPPSASQPRITLTRSRLLDSRVRLLHVTGVAKRDVLVDAIAAYARAGDAPSTPPVARVLCAAPGAVGVRWSPG